MQSGPSCPRGGGASGRRPEHLCVSQNSGQRLLPPQGVGAAGPRPKLFCGQHCTLQHRCALHSPLDTGHPAGMRISSAGGSGLAALGEGSVAMGPPSPQCPPKQSPSGGCLLLGVKTKWPSVGTQKSLSPFLSSPGILALIQAAGSR